MSKKSTHNKPITKAILKPQNQTSNHFEVLGTIPKLTQTAEKTLVNFTKGSILRIQILEIYHVSPIGEFEYQKRIFFFKTNDTSKTRKFYEFILVDIKSVQISHIKKLRRNMHIIKMQNSEGYF